MHDPLHLILGLTILFVITNVVSLFQTYGLQMFDDMESKFTKKMKKRCAWWLRAMFGYGCFFVAVAIPFLGSLAGLIGGIALPVTQAITVLCGLRLRNLRLYLSTPKLLRTAPF